VRSTEAYQRFRRVWDDKADEKFPLYATPPFLEPGQVAEERMADWLERSRRQPGAKLVAVCPFANVPSRTWPGGSVAELVTQLETQASVEVIVAGGEKDRAAADEIIRRAGTGINACGALSPAESAALFKRCSLLICTESGPMHLAGGVGVPTVTLFSRINQDFYRWFPLGTNHSVLYKDVSCAGCEQAACPVKGHPCMHGISVEEVLFAATRKLNGLPIPTGKLGGTRILNW
jgi:ADP-heptose:LPS heptosyltransferase